MFAANCKFRPVFADNIIDSADTLAIEGVTENFTENEIWDAIRDCDGNKGPGPDGFNMMCLKKWWGFMKNDILDFF